jgi:hypothetical protein
MPGVGDFSAAPDEEAVAPRQPCGIHQRLRRNASEPREDVAPEETLSGADRYLDGNRVRGCRLHRRPGSSTSCREGKLELRRCRRTARRAGEHAESIGVTVGALRSRWLQSNGSRPSSTGRKRSLKFTVKGRSVRCAWSWWEPAET